MQKSIKRVISLVLIIALFCPVVGFSERNIIVKVNGETVIFDQQPIIENDRTLVPLRKIFEAIGAKVKWDEVERTVSASKDDIFLGFKIGDAEMFKNGARIPLDVPSKIVGDRTLVPLRAISEAFDARVDWFDDTSTILIQTNVDISYPTIDGHRQINDEIAEVAFAEYWAIDPAELIFFNNKGEIKRADSEIISVIFYTDYMLKDSDRETKYINTLNYNAKTGERIYLEDVVDVNEAFAAKVIAKIPKGDALDYVKKTYTNADFADMLIDVCDFYYAGDSLGLSIPLPARLGGHIEVELKLL